MGEVDFQTQVLAMLTSIDAKVAGVSERVARVEVVHVERCGAQDKRLESVEEEQEKQRQEIQALKEQRSFSRGQQAALTAVGTVVGASAAVVIEHFMGGK